ncbi:MAG: hypothetical protein HY000_20865 [Planctomycetes bacterium]|nr:hypothetical protein [Planctomycetota bacterium]
MTVTHVPVIIFAGSFSFAGMIEHGSRRVLDVLNDVGTDFVRIQRVEVFGHSASQPIEQLGEATVPKAAIDCVMLCEEAHEAPLRRQYSFVEKQPRKVFLTLAERQVRGTIMLKGNPDPRQLLGRDAPIFFPVAEATVSAGDKIGRPIAAPVVLINKAKVSLLQIEREIPLNLLGI